MAKIEPALDRQEGGWHYKDFAIQPVEFIHANDIPFLEGNVIKYVVRHSKKNGLQDLLKAKHYIELLIQLEYDGGDSNSETKEENRTSPGTISVPYGFTNINGTGQIWSGQRSTPTADKSTDIANT